MMRIAVYGATGYTGRLVAAELARRNLEVVMIGRDDARLRATANELSIQNARIRGAALNDAAALVEAFRGSDAVISCVAPFTLYGETVLRAAIAAGCHYVDTSGEQRWVKRVFDDFSALAERAKVTVVPATTDDGVPGDLIAHLVARRLDSINTVSIAHGVFDSHITRGSMKSFAQIASNDPLVFEDGRWRASASSRRGTIDFPDESPGQPVWLLAGPEVVSVARHVQARHIEATINVDVVGGASSLTPDVIDTAPVGPAEDVRRAARFTMLAKATARDGRSIRGYVSGSDIYGITAVISVEAAIRLAQHASPPGVIAPAEAFDPAEFLDSLAVYGVRWAIEDIVAAK